MRIGMIAIIPSSNLLRRKTERARILSESQKSQNIYETVQNKRDGRKTDEK